MKQAKFKLLVLQLQTDWPNVNFIESSESRWSPEELTVFYKSNTKNCTWSLLHELGHMLCGHTSYRSDIDLLRMELEAWEKAKQYGINYNVIIQQDYVEKCLDSYRDWLHKRSTCPTCSQTGIELNSGKYSCINCKGNWLVSQNRFCRAYRKNQTPSIEKMEGVNITA